MRKRLTALALGAAMAVSAVGCGQKSSTAEATTTAAAAEETTAAAAAEEDSSRPEAVSPEDWEAMKKEPVFGTEINYLFNGGACVSAKYLAEVLGYYEEYGINATYLQGGSVVDTVGTGQCMWGTDHIATMLVPVTNGVNMSFVCGAHVGCKSIYVPADSDIQTVEDLKGKKIAIHDGIGNSDQNICYRLIDEYGVDPTSEVEFLDIADNAATVAAMESGEIDASIFSDYFVLANYRDDMRRIASITTSPEFQDEACCVTAMNNKFIDENPVHAKYVVKAIKRAGQYARLHSEEAVQLMYDTDKMTGKQEDQQEFWDSLHFGLSDAFTENALREIADDYLRLGIITKKDLTTDDVMKLAWREVCPDEEIEGLTVGDPVTPANAVVPVEQKGETAAASGDASDIASQFAVKDVAGRAIDYADFDLTPTAEELAAMEKEPAYGKTIRYWLSDGCTSGPTVANNLGYYEEAGLKAEGVKGTSYTEALGTAATDVAVGHIATMLVPSTNGVDLTFVGGAHISCKSIYVLGDSEYQTTEDLKGTTISTPNGIGASDYNITAMLLDADGIDPLNDVQLMPVETSACVAAMQRGEISGALLSDTFAYHMVEDGTLRRVRSLVDDDFSDLPCCIIAMNDTFINENPVISKKVVQAIQKAHSWMRENPREATEMLIKENLNSDDVEMNTILNDSLKFGLSDEFTEAGLKEIVDSYIRLDLITATDDADTVMEKAWSPVL